MQYTILIYETEDDFAARQDPERNTTYWAAYTAYSQAMVEAGVFVGGAGLLPPTTATRLRVRGTERIIQDGPYADTKEQLGGFYVIEVPNLDRALEWAARCPAAATGTVEVRPKLPPPPGR